MRRPVLTSLAITAASGALIGLGAIPASADTSITATYPVSGSTFIKALNSTVSLGPGTLTSTVDLNTSAVTSSTLSLPPATGSFKELGFIPVTATTAFVQDGNATGTVSLSKNTVSVTTQVTMQLTSLKIAGVPVLIGKSCQTSTPATITVSSQPGFNVLNGGTVAGTYTIPKFSHCGLGTLLINLTIPGSGNTISLTLGKATL
ncbi:MAG TPA: hypothetical protein VK823_20780 [Streptosporangiaceae bacterium]|jgi:hypothetical protein|nr:hypothetical protein [Streptosporangiaceae bacterium]